MYQPFWYPNLTPNLSLSFLKRINWSSLLSGTHKTLSLVNQAIPLYYNVKPIFKGLKAFSKIKNMPNNNSNSNNTSKISNNVNNDVKTENISNQSNIPLPNFFI